MRKLVAAINMTIDGFCDHTAVLADEEIHQHYSSLLSNADAIMFGRITYQLMEYWETIVRDPTENKAENEFAAVIDKIPKIVFSHTLKNVEWKTASIARRDIIDEVAALRQQPGKDILVGSRSLIVDCMNLNLIDEFQLCIHPVIAGKGLPLLENVKEGLHLKLLNTKIFTCGAVIFYYEPKKN